jgi:hypothetical protein
MKSKEASLTKTVEFIFYFYLLFFLDEKSNKKIKSERQILFLFALKACALIAIKIKFHTVRSHPPHYYQRMS